jgi:hypothetical protein
MNITPSDFCIPEQFKAISDRVYRSALGVARDEVTEEGTEPEHLAVVHGLCRALVQVFHTRVPNDLKPYLGACIAQSIAKLGDPAHHADA